MSRGERWVPDARLVKRREPCFSLLVPELELRRGGGGGGIFRHKSRDLRENPSVILNMLFNMHLFVSQWLCVWKFV